MLNEPAVPQEENPAGGIDVVRITAPAYPELIAVADDAADALRVDGEATKDTPAV